MNYGKIGREDMRGGGSDNGGVGIDVGEALDVRALGAARRRMGAVGIMVGVDTSIPSR